MSYIRPHVKRWYAHIALGFCAVMFLNILAVPLTYLDFKLRQDYYASVCQNQDRPITVCGGRCYLKKQLAPIEDEATTVPVIKKIVVSEYIFLAQYAMLPLRQLSTANTGVYLSTVSSLHPTGVFQPPRV